MEERRTGGEEVMRRRKRNTILRIALGLAIAAIVPTTALAKPVPLNQDVEDRGQYQLGPGEIPYYSQGTVQDQVMELGLSEGKIQALGIRGQSSDDRAVTRATPVVGGVPTWAKQIETPYLRLPEPVPNGSDDRSFSKATPVDTTPTQVVSDSDGRSIDFNPYTVTGFALALLLAMGIGMGIAVRHSRKTKLSPA
jgi:hypothetical protein